MWTLKTMQQRLCRVARRDKTLPRIQNTSQNPKTLCRIQKHVPESKTLPRIQNTSQNPKTLPRIQKHVPESKNTSQNPKHVFLGRGFGFWEVFWILRRDFGLWEVFWILRRVFGFWEVFWILGRVLDILYLGFRIPEKDD